MPNKPEIRVLVCPLNWGLGHATRCVPVIKLLISNGFRVFIATDGLPLNFLKSEFPGLDTITFPGFSPSYPKGRKLVLKMLFTAPSFLTGIIQEHRKLRQIIKNLNINIVVSDNRYGLWNRQVKSIMIIHQIMVKAPRGFKLFEPLFFMVNKLMINRFDECWIPDLPEQGNLSGDLSHKYPLPRNAHFIGWLSRFSSGEQADKQKNGLVAVLSGPEPQRTILEQQLIKALSASSMSCTLVLGKPGNGMASESINGIRLIPHLATNEMETMLKEASLVICRPGYTTIMDLAAIGARALFIPTPGQTEQEYLAEYLYENGYYYYVKQDELRLPHHLQKATIYPGVKNSGDPHLLIERVEKLKQHFKMPS